jgi:hypothetical protein
MIQNDVNAYCLLVKGYNGYLCEMTLHRDVSAEEISECTLNIVLFDPSALPLRKLHFSFTGVSDLLIVPNLDSCSQLVFIIEDIRSAQWERKSYKVFDSSGEWSFYVKDFLVEAK